MSKVIQLALRGLEFFWTLLIMALIGNMIQEAFHGNPSSVNFAMVVGAFAMASLLYLVPATLKDFGVPVVAIALDIINTILFFIAGVVLAAKLGVHSCGNAGYVKTNSITNGSHDMSKRCHEAQASTAFFWFGFACFAASSIFSFTGNSGSVNMRGVGIGGIRRGGGPSMSQV